MYSVEYHYKVLKTIHKYFINARVLHFFFAIITINVYWQPKNTEMFLYNPRVLRL